jgi:NAD(P)-dependent dehydrogenase (short-subunit alcohol dehydrogenase family)
MTRQGGGVVVNIASVHGLLAYAGHPAYDSAKAGLIALTRQAALDYGRHGVRVVAVSPGLVVDGDPRAHPRSAMFPVGRTGTPEDLAELVAYLCSPRAGFIHGANLVIDGGITAFSPAMYWTPDPAPAEREGRP